MMESSIFNLPMEMAGPNGFVIDGSFPDTQLVSLYHRSAPDLSCPSHAMATCPSISMLQGEPVENFNASGLHSSNNPQIVNSDVLIHSIQYFSRNIIDSSTVTSCSIGSEVENQFMSVIRNSSAFVEPLLDSEYIPHENLSNLEASAPSTCFADTQKSLVSNVCVDETFASCMFGGIGSKLDFSDIAAPAAISETKVQSFQSGMNMECAMLIASENVMSSRSSSSSRVSNELSLSLATNQPSVVCGTTIPDQISHISSIVSSDSSIERQLCCEQTTCKTGNLWWGFDSHNSFQISHLLPGSKYLKAMQEILAEVSSYSLKNLDQVSYPSNEIEAETSVTCSPNAFGQRNNSSVRFDDSVDEDCRFMIQKSPMSQGQEIEMRKKEMLDLLRMVDDRYNRCLDEIHTVISAFHAVTELDPSMHSRFPLQSISFLYKNLREKISSFILSFGLHPNKHGVGEERSFETSFLQKQWGFQQMRRTDHQLWKPQRGLPERSVSVLRAWMFQNFLHPYPKDSEKHLLAVKSGLTRSQVSNWFINARVRLWKPMIEEMYSEINRRSIRTCNEAAAPHSIR